MTIKTERLKESIKTLGTEAILQYTREFDNPHGIIAVTDVVISPDKSYADFYVHGQWDDKELTKFLSHISRDIHIKISEELALRKTPRIRFRIAKNAIVGKDILTTIKELDEQYGLSKDY